MRGITVFEGLLHSYSDEDSMVLLEGWTQINGTEQRSQKETYTSTTNCFLTTVQKQYGGERTAFPINGAGAITHSQTKQ